MSKKIKFGVEENIGVRNSTSTSSLYEILTVYDMKYAKKNLNNWLLMVCVKKENKYNNFKNISLYKVITGTAVKSRRPQVDFRIKFLIFFFQKEC